MQSSPAVAVALAHIDAWSHHNWDKTRELLSPDVHALVASTDPKFGTAEFTGVDNYMPLKMKGASLVEPGSVEVLSAIGDETGALVSVTFRIALGPNGSMVTMARGCAYLIDAKKRIKEERDVFILLPK